MHKVTLLKPSNDTNENSKSSNLLEKLLRVHKPMRQIALFHLLLAEPALLRCPFPMRGLPNPERKKMRSGDE